MPSTPGCLTSGAMPLTVHFVALARFMPFPLSDTAVVPQHEYPGNSCVSSEKSSKIKVGLTP